MFGPIRFIRNGDAALRPQAQREPTIQPLRTGHDLRWKAVFLKTDGESACLTATIPQPLSQRQCDNANPVNNALGEGVRPLSSLNRELVTNPFPSAKTFRECAQTIHQGAGK
jgi:hypothetical protein